MNLEQAQNIKKEFTANGSNYHNGSQPHISDSKITKLERNLPKLSVIIPVYQEEKILDETLSLFCKEMRKKYDFELIVSDGGSTDATVEIAQQHCDKVEVHKLERRQTIAEGRNMGAKSATGDILIFINADTFPANFDVFFETIIKWFQGKNYKKYDALACYVSAFPEEEELKDRIFYKIHNNYVKLLNLMGLGMGRGECQIVKRKLFEEIGGYNSKLVAGEDFDLYRRIAKVGRIKFERKIHVFESPRRFRKFGYTKTILYWIINSLAVIFWGRSISKEWEAVR